MASSSFRAPADWTPTARLVAELTEQGIRSARSHDLDGCQEAVDGLVVHGAIIRGVHAHMMRELLETAYQDGLDGDDVAEVLTRTVADAALWNAPTTHEAIAAVLTGALGVADRPNGATTAVPDPRQVIAAVFVVSADLVTLSEVDQGEYVTRAVEEVRRAQTVEMP